jgi:hypothetical protein
MLQDNIEPYPALKIGTERILSWAVRNERSWRVRAATNWRYWAIYGIISYLMAGIDHVIPEVPWPHSGHCAGKPRKPGVC